MRMLHICVNVTHQPSGIFITRGFFGTHLFSTLTLAMMKIEDVPVFAIACDIAMVMALRHSCDAGPNNKCATLTSKAC
jgi:hypothetical protein